MKTDLLTNRHNGIQDSDLPVMLQKIGVESLDELNKVIKNLRKVDSVYEVNRKK